MLGRGGELAHTKGVQKVRPFLLSVATTTVSASSREPFVFFQDESPAP